MDDPPIKIHPDDVLNVLRLNGAPPKECLENALAQVDKDARDAVVRVLYDAKVEKILGEIEGRGIDFTRTFEKHRKPASIALKEFRYYLTAIGASAGLRDSKYRWLDETILVLDKMEWPVPSRRAKEGRHPQPWINKARGNLKRLGVSRDLSEELLLACGIRRPRSKDDD
jgi:hypothetical protein